MKTTEPILRPDSSSNASLEATPRCHHVVKILPHLPPAACGVADHATAVGAELDGTGVINVRYVGVNSGDDVSTNSDSLVLKQKTSAELLDVLRLMNPPRSACIALHYSAYSLGKRGVCFWVPRALGQFKVERPDIQLMTMFHELWSPAPLLSKSGWVVPLQKLAIRSLAQISDIVRTNRVEYKRQLEKICPDLIGKVRVKNICSNFGEPNTIPPICERKRQIVIFQPPDLGTIAGREFWQSWQVFSEKFALRTTIVAGRVRKIPEHDSIECRGFVTTTEASHLLLESQFVFFKYYDGYLGKSSFFGSIAAHGTVPVMPSPNSSEDEGLVHRKHYLTPADIELFSEESLDQLSMELRKWYSEHSISATAIDYINSMNDVRVSA